MATAPDRRVLARLASEFLEMPGLQLTTAQAARLFSLDVRDCEQLLTALVSDSVLIRRPDGRYTRESSS